ncbi:MAG TPA: MerR family transcriptional regulator [bacterium]|nr:MerR family transcriptional regulator [bacterium]HOL46809.1 MerR family transcriptional regulator [bacterium]HPQ18665.1 MerR family transcriptional regulator [bacterium]
MNDLFTIDEISSIVNLKPELIKFIEKEFDLPAYKKTEPKKYSQQDIDLLNKIKYLLFEEKYTIEGAKQKLKNFDSQKNIKEFVIKELTEIEQLLEE